MAINEVKGDEHNIFLEEEIEFKRTLYSIQIESARKDLEIKIEVLNQIKDLAGSQKKRHGMMLHVPMQPAL
ncbi:hypothetical protein B5X24_HaOG216302 [Helicoverpa armigera]|uniref:Uncharacterized protein n=1 Tax=Helicoverpa armigera TaxID=29058 RepID=A0A2W1B6H8_HELAM|nr:hypothetical protein B5X24_HaOG216302 [Helicoverpa armigera]